MSAGGTGLVKGVDYTLSSWTAGRKNVGTYSITVKLKGSEKYKSCSKKLSYKINPKPATILSAVKYKKAFKARWKKQATKMSKSRITGYQVQYSTSSNFANSKKVTVKGYKKTSKKITKLKAKTKYYMRVRTYMKVSGTTYYSTWSKTKSVKTK